MDRARIRTAAERPDASLSPWREEMMADKMHRWTKHYKGVTRSSMHNTHSDNHKNPTFYRDLAL